VLAGHVTTRVVLVAGLAAVALACVGVAGAPACACGALLRATAVSEKALVSHHRGRETIVPGLAIERVGPSAAVLFPVPGKPSVTALPARTDVFGELEAATAQHTTGAPSTGAGAPAPTVVSHRFLGGYEVSVLKGGSGETLFGWLRSHAYSLPAGAQPILGRYSRRRWYFVALKLADRRGGEVKPLAISFSSRRIVYPMRLSALAAKPIGLELFLNADGPVRTSGVSGLHKTFAGATASLSPVPSAPVRSLLTARYLTRFDSPALAPASIKSDLLARVVRARHAAAGGGGGGHPLRYAGIAVLVLAVLGGGAYLLSRRRRVRPGAGAV
jgi:hypothetical protein